MDINRKNIEVLVKNLQGITHPVRMIILYALLKEEKSVGDLSQITGASQSVTSQHLGKMRDIGIIDCRKESNRVYYYLKESPFSDLIRYIVQFQVASETKVKSKKK